MWRKETTLILPKTSLKLRSSQCSSFRLTTYLLCGGRVFQQRVVIPMDTKCALLFADVFLYSYEEDFIHLKTYEKKPARSFNFTLRYWYDVLRTKGDFVDRIYSIVLEIKDTINTESYVSYFDLHLEIDSECRFKTKLYHKRDDFNFTIANFPFMCSSIPAAPAYGVYFSISLSVDPIFQSLWFISWFPW